jgi:RimJ/RimL family protein N-acetyltransferase
VEFSDRVSSTNDGETRSPLQDGWSIRRLDASLFERCLWRDHVLAYFGSVDRFLRDGLGVCLTRGDEIVSEAYAHHFATGRVEIGTITAEGHRGRRYAALICRHLAEMLEGMGLETLWGCAKENVASVATAPRLGYRSERSIRFYLYNATG